MVELAGSLLSVTQERDDQAKIDSGTKAPLASKNSASPNPGLIDNVRRGPGLQRSVWEALDRYDNETKQLSRSGRLAIVAKANKSWPCMRAHDWAKFGG